MTPALCAKQFERSIEAFLKTYVKWMDGQQNAPEMARLESLFSSPELPRDKRKKT
ncbi:hypothetical protein [Burkholderia sp.]|uniref:hypothetical protein n=1 Tax=Burkholderia sp. TaxID=36773 RepID=UPI0025C2167D|nr:hypothetical protein [Burkholderia sp.]MBS6361729.1 hypothetical protein [Burkholderia sp.]